MLPKLQHLLKSDNTSISDIADLLKIDAPVTAQVIKISNCPYYGANNKTHNINEAVNRIGSQDIYRIVAIASTGDAYIGSLPLYKIPKGQLWETSARCATMMQDLAPKIGGDIEDVYTVGLLHSLGKIIIQSYKKNSAIDGYEAKDYPNGLSYWDERTLLSFDHGQVGATLLKQWDFPDSMYLPIQNQFEPLQATDYTELTCLLSLCRDAAISVTYAPQDFEASFDNPDIMERANVHQPDLIQAAEDSARCLELLN